MRIVLVHEYYQQAGGEDKVFEAERELLAQYGHEVHTYTEHNDRVPEVPRWRLAAGTVWSRSSYRRLRALCERVRADVVHFHNTLPLISPAGYRAAKDAGAAVVQTLHNYRLLCPKSTLFREGTVCERCVGRSVPWPALRHRCYRDSFTASATLTAMLAFHRGVRTWRRAVDRYIVLTDFARDKFIEGGLPPERIELIPNFLQHTPAPGSHEGDYVLFVGRLSPEKGVGTLIEAWERGELSVPLRVVGDGPMAAEVKAAANQMETVQWLGQRDDVSDLMRDAAALVVPSTWYEGFPMVVVEAMATGLPILASRLGSLGSVVEPGRTGLHFNPGQWQDLAQQVQWLVSHPGERRRLGALARAAYESRYTADHHYNCLIAAYRAARKTAGSSAEPG